MPDGTYITLPRPGINILDETGRFIELGDWAGLAQAAKLIRDLQVILKAWLLICRVLRFLTIL